jgi:hypothetical protein
VDRLKGEATSLKTERDALQSALAEEKKVSVTEVRRQCVG